MEPQYRHWKRNVIMMVGSQILVMTGFTAAMPFIPLYLKEGLGIINESDRGFYVSMFNLGGLLAYGLFNPIWGTLSDRFGVKPMLLRGTFLTCIFFPMMAYVGNVWLLVLLRFITAACAGTTVAAQTLLVKNTPENNQGLALGMLTTAYWTGSMLGNVAGGLVVSYYGYTAAFWFCGILYFAAGLFVVYAKDDYIPAKAMPQKTHTVKRNRFHFPEFTSGVRLILLLTLLAGLAFSLEGPYISMLIEQIVGIKKAAFWTGIISSGAAVGSVIAGVVNGYLADRVRPMRLLIPILVMTGIFLLIQATSPVFFKEPEVQWTLFGKSLTVNLNLLVFGISRVLMLLTLGGSGAIFMKLLANSTPKRKRGSVFGFRSTAHCCGGMLASLIAGGIIYLCGNVRSVFYGASLFVFLLIPLAVWIIRRVMAHPFYRAHSPFGKR
ncbi:MAG: MFS transporter [Lentisphaeria bacterium]|nr:MFS transporter [Lentisphaeria bacterium]